MVVCRRTMSKTSRYNHEPVENAELVNVTETVAAKIAGELDTTSIERIKGKGDGEYKVELAVEGGFTAFVHGNTPYGIKSVLGQGNPETITLHVVEKRV